MLNFLTKTPCWPTEFNQEDYGRIQKDMHLSAMTCSRSHRGGFLGIKGPHHLIPIMTPSLSLLSHLRRWKAEIQIILTRADLFIFRLISVYNLSAQMFTGVINTWKKRPKSISLTWNFKHACISCLSSVLRELSFTGGLKHGFYWVWVKRPATVKDHPLWWWNP